MFLLFKNGFALSRKVAKSVQTSTTIYHHLPIIGKSIKISDLSEFICPLEFIGLAKAMFAEQQLWRQGAGHPEALQQTFDKVPFGCLGHRSQIRWFWTKMRFDEGSEVRFRVASRNVLK